MSKKSAKISSLRDIKTLQRHKKSSIPYKQKSPYLDLYMFHKEKDRLEREFQVLDERKNTIQRRIKEINREMDKLQKAEASKKLAHSRGAKSISGKSWKKISLNY